MLAYDTKINQRYGAQIRGIIKDIETQTVTDSSDMIKPVRENVLATTHENEKLEHWAHPLIINDKVYIDVRPFLNKNGDVKNTMEYNALVARALAELEWYVNPAAYEAIMTPLSAVAGEWVATGISTRYDLPELDRVAVKITTVYYYVWSILKAIDDNIKREEVVDVAVKTLTRKMAIPASVVVPVLESEAIAANWFGGTPNVHTLALLIRETTQTVMGDFTGQTLIQLMSMGSWIGDNAPVLSAMCLEHPPTLAVLVSRTVDFRMYQNKTRIGRAGNALSRAVNLDTVVSFVARIVEED